MTTTTLLKDILSPQAAEAFRQIGCATVLDALRHEPRHLLRHLHIGPGAIVKIRKAAGGDLPVRWLPEPPPGSADALLPLVDRNLAELEHARHNLDAAARQVREAIAAIKAIRKQLSKGAAK